MEGEGFIHPKVPNGGGRGGSKGTAMFRLVLPGREGGRRDNVRERVGGES